MKKSFLVMKTEIGQTLRQTKILMIIFFLVLLYESILSPMRILCDEVNFSVNIFEPFILLCTKSTNLILIPMVYLFILSGFPFCKKQCFQMIRTGKRQWFYGELMFIALSAWSVTFIIFICSILFMVNQIEPLDSWSGFMTFMYENYPQKYAENVLLFLDSSIVAHGEPLGIFFYTFAMMWIYLVICGLCMLFGTIRGHRIAALATTVSVTMAGGICSYLTGRVKWIFPLVHMEYGDHFNSVFSEVFFPIWGSIAYYFILVIALLSLCLYCLNKMNVGNDT